MTANVTTPTQVASLLANERSRFRGFLVKRLGSEADAEDVLQQSLLTLLRRGDKPRDGERAVAWFYRVLTRALIDRARSDNARRQREENWSRESEPDVADPDLRRAVCLCLSSVVDTLPTAAAEVLRRIDLQETPVATVAADLGITINAANVRLYRARKALRTKLEAFCGACAAEKCLDCGCRSTPADKM